MGHRTPLRSIAQHVERVLDLVEPLPAVDTTLGELVDGIHAAASGSGGERFAPGAGPLVLAQDVRAADAVPPFDNAAMDGYAVRLADLPASGDAVTLRVVGDLPAAPLAVAPGSPGTTRLGPGEAVRIMTGAPLPPGADAVVPVERTSIGRFVAGSAVSETAVTLSRLPRTHVRRRGEDLRGGDLLAVAGSPVTAALLASVAASGTDRVLVHRRPRVAVIATGSELAPAGALRQPGQIVDSNSLMLAAAARDAGADVVRLGPVPDTGDALRAALDQVAGSVDLIVTAGGVSAGAADVVREVLALAQGGSGDDGTGGATGGAVPERTSTLPGGTGVGDPVTDAEVVGVGMQPGRPQATARWRGVPWIAVPGNPVSAFVSFTLFARPAISRLRGVRTASALPVVHRRVARGWPSPRDREQVLPVRVLATGEVEPALSPTGGGSGGHLVSALAAADALAVVARDVDAVGVNHVVSVLDLRPGLPAALGDPAEVTARGGTSASAAEPRFDAVVLAGGRAARLGGVAKPGLLLGGVPLLRLALAAVDGARQVAVVGPESLAQGVATGRALLTREDPPFGGPVAGIDAGLSALGAASAAVAPGWVVVLAVDAPRAAGAVPLLLDSVVGRPDLDGAFLTNDGRAQWLVGIYRRDALSRRLDALRAAGGLDGVPVRRLVDGLRCLEIPDPGGLTDDVDTWADAARLGATPPIPE